MSQLSIERLPHSATHYELDCNAVGPFWFDPTQRFQSMADRFQPRSKQSLSKFNHPSGGSAHRLSISKGPPQCPNNKPFIHGPLRVGSTLCLQMARGLNPSLTPWQACSNPAVRGGISCCSAGCLLSCNAIHRREAPCARKWARWDSNPHAPMELRLLRPLRLPIPPRARSSVRGPLCFLDSKGAHSCNLQPFSPFPSHHRASQASRQKPRQSWTTCFVGIPERLAYQQSLCRRWNSPACLRSRQRPRSQHSGQICSQSSLWVMAVTVGR